MHVLIIDDDPTFRHLLATHMRNNGLRVSVAQDGLHGQRMAREEQPDVILLDHLMPAASGLTVLERLKKFGETAQIPVIMISGSDDPTLRTEAKRNGAIGLLNKNLLTESDLVAALEDASRVEGTIDEDFAPLFPGQQSA